MRTIFVVGAAAMSAHASPIEYRLVGDASGSVDGVPFTGAFETVLGADTDDIFHGKGFHLVFGETTIDLEGYGEGLVIDGTAFAATNDGDASNVALLNTFLMDEILAAFDPSIESYDLDGAFGPVTDADPFHFFVSVETSFGPVTFDDVSTLTFEAVIVPVPWTATVVGGVLIVARGRRPSGRA